VSVTLYGIKNCDTMKRARTWLEAHSIEYAFHDYKASGVNHSKLAAWCKRAGWEKILNRSGTTFRKLSDSQRTDLTEAKAIDLMLAQPSMIKRPVLELDGRLLVGFDPDTYERELARS
jgi:arsenate reductase (glutaredoxin)